jgi:hypothetical protein
MTATLWAVRCCYLVLAAVVFVVGCKPRTGSRGPDGDPDGTGATEAVQTPPEGEETSTMADGRPKPQCIEGGRIWDGHHTGCLYEVAGCCYDTPAAACTAAGCGGNDCRIMEFSPAQIVCEDAPDSASPAQS